MKIYLFNPETGVYLGEDFADKSQIQGGLVVSPGSTKIAPPEGGRGQILDFDIIAQCWKVRSQMNGDTCLQGCRNASGFGRRAKLPS